jgi:uncharacterized protein YbgA (DUF1722 family)
MPVEQELAATIDEYRRGLVPLVVPITLLRHHARQHETSYLLGQSYLEPHPRELMLRNRCESDYLVRPATHRHLAIRL